MNKKEIAEIRRRLNVERAALTCIRGCYVNTNREIVSMFKQSPKTMPEEELFEAMGAYAYHEYLYNIPAKQNVIPVLKALKARGADLHVLTASPHVTLDPCLKRLHMFDLFENVWSCEDFGTTKADPAIYGMVAEKIGKPIQEILFLDDNFNADKTAKEAGMRVCGVYDASSEEYTDEIKAVTDHYIYDFSELLALN